ncbi:MAG TPA: 2'-5' RNA ligase family protein [Gemmatimonadales bacterium]|nr:2'-5' RNA ligase family protein [Gemmatimonadales bacterium]
MTTGDRSAPRLALWFLPEGAPYRALQALIARLSAEHRSPLFEPHVTLLGHITLPAEEAKARAERLARLLHPFTLRLNRAERGTGYFRALYLRAEPDPALREAHRLARTVFGREGDPPYLPHLSLLYGDFPVATRQRILAEIGPWHEIVVPVRGLHLVDTSGVPEGWRRIAEVELGDGTPAGTA